MRNSEYKVCVFLTIFFSRMTAPEMPVYSQKLVCIPKILYGKNRNPKTKTGAPDGSKVKHRNM